MAERSVSFLNFAGFRIFMYTYHLGCRPTKIEIYCIIASDNYPLETEERGRRISFS